VLVASASWLPRWNSQPDVIDCESIVPQITQSAAELSRGIGRCAADLPQVARQCDPRLDPKAAVLLQARLRLTDHESPSTALARWSMFTIKSASRLVSKPASGLAVLSLKTTPYLWPIACARLW